MTEFVVSTPRGGIELAASPDHEELATFPIDPAVPYAVRLMAGYLQKGGRLGCSRGTDHPQRFVDEVGTTARAPADRPTPRSSPAYLRGLIASSCPGNRLAANVSPRERAFQRGAARAPRFEGMRTVQRATKQRWLRDRLVEQQFGSTRNSALPIWWMPLPPWRGDSRFTVLEDATGQELSYSQIVVARSAGCESSRRCWIATQTRGCAAAERQCTRSCCSVVGLGQSARGAQFLDWHAHHDSRRSTGGLERNHHFGVSSEKANWDVKRLAEAGSI